MKRVLISEDHTMFALMIKMWLQKEEAADIIGVAATGAETISMTQIHKPDILLQDMMLSDMQGVEIIRRVRQEFPQMAIYGMSAKANLAKLALEAGANGCMLKEDSPQVIRHIIEWDTNLGIWVSPLLGKKFYIASQELLKYNFTSIELNILRNISLPNAEISSTIGIAEGTVRNALSSIYQKTSISNRAELARYVQEVLLLAPSQFVS
jgi:DNA-binding NarL/FixJ family response regulator